MVIDWRGFFKDCGFKVYDPPIDINGVNCVNVWYAVYTNRDLRNDENANKPLALFQFKSQAESFISREYPDRASSRPVVLSASMQFVNISNEIITL